MVILEDLIHDGLLERAGYNYKPDCRIQLDFPVIWKAHIIAQWREWWINFVIFPKHYQVMKKIKMIVTLRRNQLDFHCCPNLEYRIPKRKNPKEGIKLYWLLTRVKMTGKASPFMQFVLSAFMIEDVLSRPFCVFHWSCLFKIDIAVFQRLSHFLFKSRINFTSVRWTYKVH